MKHYIATDLSLFKASEKINLLSAVLAAIHDINFRNTKPLALTFSEVADFSDINTVNVIGVTGDEIELNKALSGRLRQLKSDVNIHFSAVTEFAGDESEAYFRNKPELDPIGYQGQVKKRAIANAKRLARLGAPVTVSQLQAQHLANLFKLQEKTPHLKVKQLSRQKDKLFNLCIIKVSDKISEKSRQANIYGLCQVVPLLKKQPQYPSPP